jgi:hypothetical protein
LLFVLFEVMPPPEKEEDYDAALREGVETPALLRRLHRSLTHPATLAQCVGGRSKSVPSRVVQRLAQAESSFHLSDLQASHEYIMTRMILSIQTQLLDGTKSLILPYMEQLQCLGRFLEFLLEYPNPDGNSDNGIPSMVLQLLRACSDLALTKTVDNLMPGDLMNHPVEDAPLPTALRIWLYTTLLRLNQYCHRGRPFLLSMIWKSLASLSTSFRIPVGLIHQAQSALLQHLQDGLPPIVQSIVDASSSPPSLLWKIVGFLLARWAAIAQSVANDNNIGDDETHPARAAIPTLVLLRGLSHWSTNDNSQKTAANIDTSLSLDGTAACLARMSALCTATMPSVPEFTHMDVAQIIWDAAWTRGKVHILKNFLGYQISITATNDIVSNQDDVQHRLESILVILEELLLFLLPHMRLLQSHSSMAKAKTQGDPLEQEVMETLSRSLIWMEVQMKETQPNITVDQLHRLLVHWLSRAGSDDGALEDHDMISSLLIQFSAASSSRKALQQLLVQLFWDTRTTLRVRSQLASVIVRMVRLEFSSESSAAFLATELWSGTSEILHQWSSRSTKKRKRYSSQSNSYRIEDWHVICSVLSALPPCHDLSRQNTWTNGGKISRHQLRRATVHAAIWHCGGTKTDFECILEHLLSIWKRGWSGNNSLNDSVMVLTMSVLRQVPRYFASLYSLSVEDPSSSRAHGMTMVIQLLTHCTASVLLESQLVQTGRWNALTMQMIVDAIEVLGALGPPFSYSGISNSDGVQSVARCFHRLLSSPWWSLRSFTMASFLQFASTLPVTYKSMLPQCVPVSMQSLLQCRLQKAVDCALIGGKEDFSTFKQQGMDAYVASSSTGTDPTKRRFGPVFPTKSYTLPAGSYCLTLPTQEGRRALVIFPPGPDSLLDLRGMLGEAEEENHVHQLRQDVLLSCGNVLNSYM